MAFRVFGMRSPRPFDPKAVSCNVNSRGQGFVSNNGVGTHELQSKLLKGGYIGDYIGEYCRGYLGGY